MSGYINTLTNQWALYDEDLIVMYGTNDITQLDFIKPVVYANRPEVVDGQTMEPIAPKLINNEYVIEWLVRDKTTDELKLEAEMNEQTEYREQQ